MTYEGGVPDLSAPRIATISNGHWKFPEQMGVGNVGFIYIIRDNYLEKFYLGKKQFYGTGRSNRGDESNWRSYKSSSKALKAHFAERPIYEEFDFICLEQYATKGTLSYSETWSLCLVEVPTSDRWYNRLIPKVSWNVNEPISDRHKDRLHRVLAKEDFSEER